VQWGSNSIYWAAKNIEVQPTETEKIFWLNQLPDSFTNTINKSHRWQDAWASITGYKLLFQLSKAAGIAINLQLLARDCNNKPYLKNDVVFNISHTNNMVVCAIQKQGLLGVDVELIQDINPNDFSRVFHKQEMDYINKNCPTNFFETWTKKEAIIKAIGTGFLADVKHINTTNKNYSHQNGTLNTFPLDLNNKYVGHLCSSLESPCIMKITDSNLSG
jgi:4'-phosphopantetheinyl transferase